MNLYIDTNIFLDFYHLTSVDVEELKKLTALVDEGEITLFSTEQLCDEIERNRDSKVADALEKFRKSSGSFKLAFPTFCKGYPEYDEIREALKSANKKHAELLQKATADVVERKLGADEIIEKLLEDSQRIDTTQKIFDAAIRRFRVGNPPGKDKNTVGDELNWESLLAGVPEGEDLYLVSDDKDFKSTLDSTKISSFLKKEWERVKKSEIHFYTSLPEFFKEHFQDIKIASDVKANKYIEMLAGSANFATTHLLVGALAKIPAFSQNQVEELVQVAAMNNQVHWIMGDDDLTDFYTRLLNDHGGSISKESKETLEDLLTPEVDGEPDDEEIPF